MAKNNKNRKNNNRPNYFSKNIKDNGENFLDGKDINSLLRDAKMVFKDMAFQNINLEQNAVYFQNPQFMNALMEAANKEFFEASFIASAIDSYFNMISGNGMMDPRVPSIREKYVLKCNAYKVLAEGLAIFAQTQDPNNLFVLCANLAPYKHYI